MHLEELLAIKNISERDKSLRRAFSRYSEVIDITGTENKTLIILLNLTYRKVQVDDLLDKKKAKTALHNEDLINKCIDELQWFHTHNLKYPDIRVSKQNLAVDSPLLHPYVLSSANYHRAYGWTHNSAQVNLVKFFGSYFYWQGKECCLAEVLAAPSIAPEWKAAFQSLGIQVKLFLNLCARIKGFLPQTMIPNVVDRYSTQVRMPYHDGYVAITPVVSHVLQSKIQQAAISKKGKFNKIEFTRSAAVSQLVASLGGVVNILSYPPNINKKHYDLHHSHIKKIHNGNTVLNVNALIEPFFFRALDGLIFNSKELALKQRRQQQVKNTKTIRNTLSVWLAPVLEWRLDVIENKVNIDEFSDISNTVEYKFLSTLEDELFTLIMPTFSLLNETLANMTSSQKYAFHPKLMTHFKTGLKWLLNNIANEGSVLSNNDSENRYLYLRDIRVFDAQTLSNPYCNETPSLTAIWGMMHNYQRKLNEAIGTKVRFTSFSWFIKGYSPVKGKKLPEESMQGTVQSKIRRPGIVDNKYCDLRFDLVIHIDGTDDDLCLIDKKSEALKAHFPSTFAGGVMLPPELDLAIDWCHLYSDENLLFKKLRRLPLSGRWVMPTKHKICDLKALLLLLEDNTELSPTMFGYMLLDKPIEREGALENLHCYAEPTIGLIEYTTAINIRLKGQKSYFNNAFWVLDAQEQFMLMKGI